MRRLWALIGTATVLATISPFGLSALASVATSTQQSRELEITVTAHGYRTALKLDDTTCQFGFPNLIDDPVLLILDEDGNELLRQPLGVGAWSMNADEAYCTQSYRIMLPPAESYTIQIPPYFTQEYTSDELDSGTLALEVTRNEGDPFPLPVRPKAGPIPGGANYRIVGTLELRGEAGRQFINMPDCMGLGGYDDIRPGTRLTITDERGNVIAVTSLEPDPLSERFDECVLQFVAEVPRADFYTISMGRRGEITFSYDELEDADWFVELSLG